MRRGGKSGVVSDSADVKGGRTRTWIDEGCSRAPRGISIPFVVSTSTTTCSLSPCELTSISYTTRMPPASCTSMRAAQKAYERFIWEENKRMEGKEEEEW